MKFIYPGINNVFEITNQYVNTIVIENRKLFYNLCSDIYNQTEGLDGKVVLSKKDTPIPIAKNLELINDFIGFNINRKPLINKIIGALENIAIDAEHYLNTNRLLSDIEQSVNEWSFPLSCNIVTSKINVTNVLKAVGIEICDDYVGISGQAEKIIDYMELVREFDKDKLFITVNMRSFFPDSILTDFIKTVLDHDFKLLMIENCSYEKLPRENRRTIDEDYCEF